MVLGVVGSRPIFHPKASVEIAEALFFVTCEDSEVQTHFHYNCSDRSRDTLRKPLLHLLRNFVAGITRLIFRFDIEGRDHLPDGGALLVANHISLLDPFFIIASIPRLVFFVMYRKIYEYWLWHWFMKRINMIPIDGGLEKGRLEEFNRTCREMVNSGEMI